MVTKAKTNERIVKAGIKVDGVLLRSEDWLVARIALLKTKQKDYAQRIKNANTEIALREKELEELNG